MSVPAGFTELEYIESTGTQYIDTGYLFVDSTRIEIDCNITENSIAYPSPFGVRVSTSGSGSNALYLGMSGATAYYAFGGAQKSKANAWVYGERTQVVAQKNEAAITRSGTTVTADTYAPTGYGTLGLYLFAENLNGAPWAYSMTKMRLYRCTIYEGNTPVRDLIPALDGSDVACLYDDVTQTAFYNAGTGDFLPGFLPAPPPDVGKKLFLAGLAVGRQLKGWATLHRENPTHIEIIQPPTLREYADGAALDFSGLEVVLRKADGGRYTDANYPDGIVPMSELSFPVAYAHFDGTGGQGAGEFYVGDTLAFRSLYCEERTMSYADYRANNLHSPVAKLFREGYGYGEWFIFWDHTPFRVAYLGGGHFLAAAASDHQSSDYGETNTRIGVSSYSSGATWDAMSKYVYDGKEVYYLDLSYYGAYLTEPYLEPSEVVNAGAAAWAMVYGDLGEKQPIPVEWTAPLTRFPALPTMRDTFSIFVHENEE